MPFLWLITRKWHRHARSQHNTSLFGLEEKSEIDAKLNKDFFVCYFFSINNNSIAVWWKKFFGFQLLSLRANKNSISKSTLSFGCLLDLDDCDAQKRATSPRGGSINFVVGRKELKVFQFLKPSFRRIKIYRDQTKSIKLSNSRSNFHSFVNTIQPHIDSHQASERLCSQLNSYKLLITIGNRRSIWCKSIGGALMKMSIVYHILRAKLRLSEVKCWNM